MTFYIDIAQFNDLLYFAVHPYCVDLLQERRTQYHKKHYSNFSSKKTDTLDLDVFLLQIL